MLKILIIGWGMYGGFFLEWTCARGMSGWSGGYAARSSGMDRGPHKSLPNKDPCPESACLSFLMSVRKERVGVVTGAQLCRFYVFFGDTGLDKLF
jgi:hypothetical protein